MLLPEATGLTQADLERFPDDGQRRELIDGELFVSARPAYRHQRVLGRIHAGLYADERDHGGEVVLEPNNDFSHRDHVEPDLAYVRPEHLDERITRRGVEGPADLVVEVSSPSTRSFDLVRKRRLYEREGVPEYWFVDLDEDALVVHRLGDGYYGHVLVLGRGDTVTSPVLPGLALDVGELLGPRES